MPYREQIPIDRGLDNSLALLLEGYQYITNRRNQYNRDIFETRLLGGQKTICIAGKEAAEVFYDENKFIRKGAAPKRVRQTLFGENVVQTLDNKRHKQRKALFMSLMTDEGLQEIENITYALWQDTINSWERKDKVILFEEAKLLLTKVACKWAGVPLKEQEAKLRADQLSALFDSAAAIGLRHWRGRHARNQAEKWIANLVEEIRNDEKDTSKQTALYKMAMYRDEDGELLDSNIIAAEVLNILRPIVAIAVYIVFSALAIHQYPEEREKLKSNDESYLEMFVQEIRRYYPFFPFAAARVRDDFLWKGHDFKKGNLVLLDIYGTNHHSDLWNEPFVFNPERFKERPENAFDLIPQGGGSHHMGHRCPGEWITLRVMKVSINVIINQIQYDVPNQNLNYSMRRVPSIPNSRFIISHVKKC
ncbi:cytochrome P450 [Oceanobacillus piezotolerans]|uniref:Cytochrome P450 n=1 Tax=Oceanobacillus piezotolerans TaxID=2448030 RepID=A0A498D7F5_9BACI|nr:cytochrome P450 [Oceanobacillus piezotolerans]RLL41984.1 cytochrome P450 [Oceanobacillus piezotolerans]